MSESANDRNSRKQKVEVLIAQFEQAAERGQPIAPADFLQQHAEYATELCEYFWIKEILARNLLKPTRRNRARMRTKRRAQRLADQPEQSSPRGLSDEQIYQVTAVLAKLLDAERTAIVLKHFQGWSLAQISEHLGQPPSAIAGLLKRGLKKLRSHLQSETE